MSVTSTIHFEQFKYEAIADKLKIIDKYKSLGGTFTKPAPGLSLSHLETAIRRLRLQLSGLTGADCRDCSVEVWVTDHLSFSVAAGFQKYC